MATVPALTARTPAQRWAEVRDEEALWGDLRPELLAAVRTILEATMEDELAAAAPRPPVRADPPAARPPQRHRTAGWLVTELGAIPTLRPPRRRLGRTGPSFLARAARRTATVDDVLRQAFLRGLSTRETAALAETLTGVALSAAAVSRLARSPRRPGGGVPPPADHVPRPLPPARRPLGQRPARARAGRSEAGHPRRLRRSTQQDAGSCSTTARRRPSRRPPGARLLPLAHRARTRPRRGRPRHRRRGRRDRRRGRRGVPRRRPPALLDPPGPQHPRGPAGRRAAALPARPAGDLPGPHPAGRGRRRTGAGRAPGGHATRSSCRGLERDLEELLAVFALPEPLRASLRTTNLIERAFRELRRRLRPIGALPDRRSADRDPLRPGAPPQRAPGPTPARCFHTRVLTSCATRSAAATWRFTPRAPPPMATRPRLASDASAITGHGRGRAERRDRSPLVPGDGLRLVRVGQREAAHAQVRPQARPLDPAPGRHEHEGSRRPRAGRRSCAGATPRRSPGGRRSPPRCGPGRSGRPRRPARTRRGRAGPGRARRGGRTGGLGGEAAHRRRVRDAGPRPAWLSRSSRAGRRNRRTGARTAPKLTFAASPRSKQLDHRRARYLVTAATACSAADVGAASRRRALAAPRRTWLLRRAEIGLSRRRAAGVRPGAPCRTRLDAPRRAARARASTLRALPPATGSAPGANPASAHADDDPVVAACAVRRGVGPLVRLHVAGPVDRPDLEGVAAGRRVPGEGPLDPRRVRDRAARPGRPATGRRRSGPRRPRRPRSGAQATPATSIGPAAGRARRAPGRRSATG